MELITPAASQVHAMTGVQGLALGRPNEAVHTPNRPAAQNQENNKERTAGEGPGAKGLSHGAVNAMTNTKAGFRGTPPYVKAVSALATVDICPAPKCSSLLLFLDKSFRHAALS